MIIHIKHSKSKYEKPRIGSVCHFFKPNGEKHLCACDTNGDRRQKIHIVNVPYKKGFIKGQCCLPCDPLFIETATAKELNDFRRKQCCPQC